MKEKIGFKEFLEIESKLEIKIGRVVEVNEVPKSDKLLRLSVDFGPDDIRTVVTNIKPYLVHPGILLDNNLAFVTNLEPVKMMGIESTAMILPGEIENSTGVPITIVGRPGVNIL